jgi:hypothetical protein
MSQPAVEIELSAKNGAEEEGQKDSESSEYDDSDDEKESAIRKVELSKEYLKRQMEEQKEAAKRSAVAARKAAKRATKESFEAIKNAGWLNLFWMVLSIIVLAFMGYLAVPEDNDTNSCSDPTSSSKLSTLPLVQFTARPVYHNFGDYEDIGLHRPDRLYEIVVAYLFYTLLALIFGMIGFFFPFIFCCCRFACCLKKCKDIDDKNRWYCPLGKCGKIPPTFHESRKILYYSKQEKLFPKMIITTVIFLVLWMVSSGQTEGVIAFVASGTKVYKLPNPVANTVKKTSPTLQKIIYDVGGKGVSELLLQVNYTLTENFREATLLRSLDCIDNIVKVELPKPRHIVKISQSLKKTNIIGDESIQNLINKIDMVWAAKPKYIASLSKTLNSFSDITVPSMLLQTKSKSILKQVTKNGNVVIRGMLKDDYAKMNQYKDCLNNLVINKLNENELAALESNLTSYENTSNSELVNKLNSLKSTLENSMWPNIVKLLNLLPTVNKTLKNISVAAQILPTLVRELTQETLTATEVALYKSKISILNESYTFQNIITSFVKKLIEINTTLVDHDIMQQVYAKLKDLGSPRSCQNDLVNILNHVNSTLFELPTQMIGAIGIVKNLNNSRQKIYNATFSFRHKIRNLGNTLKQSFFGNLDKGGGILHMKNVGLSQATSLEMLYNGINGLETWNRSIGINELDYLKINQSFLAKPSIILLSRVSDLKHAILGTVEKIQAFSSGNSTAVQASEVGRQIIKLKNNISRTIPLISANNNNYQKYLNFHSMQFYEILNSLSLIKHPNISIRDDALMFNQTLSKFGPNKSTMETDLTNIRHALYNITGYNTTLAEADGQIQRLESAIYEYTNSTSMSRTKTIATWVHGFQSERLKNYTSSVSTSHLLAISTKKHMGKSLDQIHQLFYDLCLDISNSTLVPNITCIPKMDGVDSKRAQRIEDKGNNIMPLGGAHYLMKIFNTNETLAFGTYNTKVDMYNGRASPSGVRNDRKDGSLCYTNECLKNTWAYYMQSPHVPQSEFSVPVQFSVQDFPALLYGFPIALVLLAVLQCLGFCHYRSKQCSCCSCGLCTAYIMSILSGIILLTFGAILFPFSIFTSDACLSLGVNGAKTFKALNPLFCQAIGGNLSSSSNICKIKAPPFEFNVDVPQLMNDIASNCKTTDGFAEQWERTSTDMNNSIKTMVVDSLNDPKTFGNFKFKIELKNAFKRGGKAIGSAVANNTLALGNVIDCAALNKIYFDFHNAACCSIFAPIYWIVLTWINIALVFLCCGCGSAIIGAKRFMSDIEVNIIRKKFGLEVDLAYSLILSDIKPDQQQDADMWDDERRLLKHHKTDVKMKNVQYYNVTSWDFGVSRSTREGDDDD